MYWADIEKGISQVFYNLRNTLFCWGELKAV